MDNLLLDRSILEGFVDLYINQKYPGRPAEELSSLREESIQKLDDKIYSSIFDSLNDDQIEDFNRLMDEDSDNPTAFRDFFKNAGVDLELKIKAAVDAFGEEFLGGENV